LVILALPAVVEALKFSVPLAMPLIPLAMVAWSAELVSVAPRVPKLRVKLLAMVAPSPALPPVLEFKKLRVPLLVMLAPAVLAMPLPAELPPSKIMSPLFLIVAVPAVLVFSKTVPFRNAPLTTLVVALFVILALPAVLVLRKNRAALALLLMVALSAELEPWKIRPDAVLLLNPEELLLMVGRCRRCCRQ
jgi:hypothetical protein